MEGTHQITAKQYDAARSAFRHLKALRSVMEGSHDAAHCALLNDAIIDMHNAGFSVAGEIDPLRLKARKKAPEGTEKI